MKMPNFIFMTNQLLYFPKFFHPDPTVKRQSGFLTPSFNNSVNNSKNFIKSHIFMHF